jgi:hypothetical protein
MDSCSGAQNCLDYGGNVTERQTRLSEKLAGTKKRERQEGVFLRECEKDCRKSLVLGGCRRRELGQF